MVNLQAYKCRSTNEKAIFDISGVSRSLLSFQSLITNGQIYISLMKFDFFFFLAFVMQLLVVVVGQTDPEFWLTVAAVPVIVSILLLSGYWVSRENIMGMAFVVVNISLHLLDRC